MVYSYHDNLNIRSFYHSILNRLIQISFGCLILFFSPIISAKSTNNFNRTVIQPNKSFEHCALFKKGKTKQLSFEASDPLHFSFNYKSDLQTSYLIAEHLTHKMKNVPLPVGHSQNYCLTWKNKQQTAVELTWKVH